MDYKEHIEKALMHIENNLKYDFNITELADIAGYSEYHFIRVFKEVTHLTPADYIRKRRLSEIAREIMKDERPISEIAFEYGFNSKENFIRAFKSEHHILPTEYKTSGNSLKLYERVSLQTSNFMVIPEIITLSDFELTVYASDEKYAPNFWNKYNCKKLSLKLSDVKNCKDYGICKWNSINNRLDYWIGIKTSDVKGNTEGTTKISVKGGLYAVFTTPTATHFDFVSTIHKTWEYINNVWFPNTEYQRLYDYEFENYIESSRTFSEKIYIPIRKF